MQYKTFLSVIVVGLAFTGEVAARHRKGGFKGSQSTATEVSATAAATSVSAQSTGSASDNGNGSNNANALELNPAAVQTGSESNGLSGSAVEAGQAASATDPANFINFCDGKTLTNGLQVKGGSCNGIVMGEIPSNQNMVSSIITHPQNNDVIPANTPFNFTATTINMVFGSFTNAQATYYAAPQQLDAATGNIIGHQHFSAQLMSSADTKTPLDPTKFAFFKGVNDAGDGKGDLSALVATGLKAGQYRVCTMTSASNHQPVLMPVAQRGPQDDCVRFSVVDGGGKNNGGKNNSNTGKSVASGNSSDSSRKGKGKGKGSKKGKGKKSSCDAKQKRAVPLKV